MTQLLFDVYRYNILHHRQYCDSCNELWIYAAAIMVNWQNVLIKSNSVCVWLFSYFQLRMLYIPNTDISRHVKVIFKNVSGQVVRPKTKIFNIFPPRPWFKICGSLRRYLYSHSFGHFLQFGMMSKHLFNCGFFSGAVADMKHLISFTPLRHIF